MHTQELGSRASMDLPSTTKWLNSLTEAQFSYSDSYMALKILLLGINLHRQIISNTFALWDGCTQVFKKV